MYTCKFFLSNPTSAKHSHYDEELEGLKFGKFGKLCCVHQNNYTCFMYLITAESQRQVLIITFIHLFVISFFNLLKTTQYLAHTYNSIAICNILIFSIGHIVLYCSSKYCNMSIFRYIVSPPICIHFPAAHVASCIFQLKY